MHNDEPLFIEIRPPSKAPPKPDRIEVLTSTVDPKSCGPLLKDLSKLAIKDEALSHLKRVKRQQQLKGSPPKKKAKVDLEVLLGRHENEFSSLVENYNLQVQRKLVPGRPAESTQELEDFNAIWPTIFFHKNTEEHKEKELALSETEITQMVRGMELAVADGAVIINPESDSVVSRSQNEWLLQSQASNNPLCTPVLSAIHATNSIGDDGAALAVFLTVGFLSCIGCCAPGWVWRVVCRTAGRSERAEPTPADIARIQYYIVRLFYLDFGGFLLNALAGSWLAVLFAVDEVIELGKIFVTASYLNCGACGAT